MTTEKETYEQVRDRLAEEYVERSQQSSIEVGYGRQDDLHAEWAADAFRKGYDARDKSVKEEIAELKERLSNLHMEFDIAIEQRDAFNRDAGRECAEKSASNAKAERLLEALEKYKNMSCSLGVNDMAAAKAIAEYKRGKA